MFPIWVFTNLNFRQRTAITGQQLRLVINQLLTNHWGEAGIPASLTPGDYKLRLVVTNNQNEPMPECIINITIKAQD